MPVLNYLSHPSRSSSLCPGPQHLSWLHARGRQRSTRSPTVRMLPGSEVGDLGKFPGQVSQPSSCPGPSAGKTLLVCVAEASSVVEPGASERQQEQGCTSCPAGWTARIPPGQSHSLISRLFQSGSGSQGKTQSKPNGVAKVWKTPPRAKPQISWDVLSHLNRHLELTLPSASALHNFVVPLPSATRGVPGHGGTRVLSSASTACLLPG